MGLDIPGLVRPPRSVRPVARRSALDGRSRCAPVRSRRQDERRRRRRQRAADRLGVRPDLLRRRAHDGAACRPRQQPAPDRHQPRQRPPDERQQRDAARRRDHARQRGRGRRQVRRWRHGGRTDGRAARARRHVPGAAQSRQRRPARARDRGRRARLRAPGLLAGRDHGDRPGQQTHCARLRAARKAHAGRGLWRAHTARLPGFSRHAWRSARRRACPEPAAAQHRAPALRPGENDARRLDPGLLGAAALAGPFQRRAQRHLGHGARAVRGRLRDLPPGGTGDPHAHQRRRSQRGGHRRHRARAGARRARATATRCNTAR